MERGRIEKVEGEGMKITFEVPNDTVAMALTGMCENRLSYTIATTRVETSECKDGAVIVCNWKGGEADEE